MGVIVAPSANSMLSPLIVTADFSIDCNDHVVSIIEKLILPGYDALD